MRALLSVRDRHTVAARNAIAGLPVSGWPAGLFGRRDALILALVSRLGIPVAAVGELRCGDITVDGAGSVLRIGDRHQIAAHLDADNPYGPYAVWKRWTTVRDLTLRRPSTMAPARATALPVSWHEHHYPEAALVPAFDRWAT